MATAKASTVLADNCLAPWRLQPLGTYRGPAAGKAVDRLERMAIQVRARASIALAHGLFTEDADTGDMDKVGPRKAVHRRGEDGDTSESKDEHHPRSQLGLFTGDAATGHIDKVGPRKAVHRRGEDGDAIESKGEHRPRSPLGLFMWRMRLLATWTR